MVIDSKEIRKEEGDWKIHVVNRPWDFNTEIWLIRKNGSLVQLANFDATGSLLLTELKEGADVDSKKPTMVLPSNVWMLIKKAVYDVSEPPEKSAVDAELKATKYHLDDLRRLVFKHDNK